MSSDSEIDEFYDAPDVTPVRLPSSLPVLNPTLDNVQETEKQNWNRWEEEERQLQEEERIAEERKQAIQLRREQLVREKEDLERQAEASQKKADDGERRRHRLDELRKMMEDNDTQNRPPPKPPRTYEHEDDENPDVKYDEEDSSTDEENASIFGESNNKMGHNLQTCDQDLEKVLSKCIPELVVTGEKTGVCTGGVAAVEKVIEQEPDIIQSTKASSLERAKAATVNPVAPPRRKKKKTPSGLECQESSSDIVELATPTTTAFELTRDFERSLSMPSGDLAEQSLDLKSATKGHRLVHATEEASAKAESVADSEMDNVDSSPNDIDPQRKPPAHHETREMFTVKLELREKTETSGEGGAVGSVKEIPLSMTRPRSNSGSRYLTDEEILGQVMVLNLDTGEKIPLCNAEEKLPRCINPLSLHIMRRTKEYSSDSSLHKYLSEDETDKLGGESSATNTISSVKPANTNKRRKKFKRLIGKTVSKIKSVADEVIHGQASESEEEETLEDRKMIKVRAANSHKGPYDFDLLVPMQDLQGHNGAVWSMEFSQCGRLLATGGQDCILRVWALKDHSSYFDDMRHKYSETCKAPSPAPSQDSLGSQSEAAAAAEQAANPEMATGSDEDDLSPFMKRPFCTYKGHTADLLDISWSKNYFILSSSMDKTVRLWHMSRQECLCCFQHIDFVTAIAFHPKDDRYFLSGSLDGKLRLWNIPDKKVALWNEISGQTKLITAANFCQNGNLAVVGTYDGRCVFYTTEQLKYNTQINVKSTRGKNKKGRKITGVVPYPGENKILVTSNDSRVRLYDLQDKTLTCKYKGYANNSSQIMATFSHEGKYIVSGSEDRSVYIWKTYHEFYKFSSARRDRNDYWESIRAHSAVVTSAIFAPHPRLILRPQFEFLDSDEQDIPAVRGEVLVSADYSGAIKVFINKFKPGSG